MISPYALLNASRPKSPASVVTAYDLFSAVQGRADAPVQPPVPLHSVFPFECMAKAAGLSDRRLGRRNRFSPSAKIALIHPDTDWASCLEHAEKLGLGTRAYELVKI